MNEIFGDLVVNTGSYIDFSGTAGEVAVSGNLVQNGQGDLRHITAVGGNIVVNGNGVDVGPYSFPNINVVNGNLTFINTSVGSTSARPN